jgi:hypothetical protein
MGIDSAAWLDVYDETGAFRVRYPIAGAGTDERRWVGVLDPDWQIGRAELISLAARPFAIDDVELATYTPEPTSLTVWLWGALIVGARRRRVVT